ncbi:site-specific integrase [Phyllobacterium sp. UNC302MFCol5.2]|uniref:tyrosine-type recombinase/integrase n=1 Tax=Phyllobacterium sp. UNC302MFCol5.2 TaxID=1449065 RepID=UPI000489CDB9|nr:site-specific integrase [Phyllobacterium sp. UNC302MFCol5.2]
MPKIELTDKFCQSAKTGSVRKLDYFDTLAKGLVLRVSAGGQKSWFVVYGPSNRRQWLKIGTYPEIPLGTEKGARQRAKDTRANVQGGGDPIAAKKAYVASMTVFDLVESYIARRAASRRSVDEIARRLRKNVSGYDADRNKIVKASLGCIGDVKLSELHRRDITKAIDAVKDRGAGVEANRVFEDVRAMIRWGRGRGDLDSNLTEGMARPTETGERDRVLTADEMKTMWAALAEANIRESTRRILRLCLITGQRVGEIAGIVHSELDMVGGRWTIPAKRAKNGREHVVPLSEMAIKILGDQIADVIALSGRKGRGIPPFVFPGPGAVAAVTGASVPKAVKREQIIKRGAATILGIAPWTPHDLRRSAATGMEEVGISPFVVGHVLNHVSVTKSNVTSRVYARYDYMREKREALNLWADRLANIIEGSGKVQHLGGEEFA